MKRRYNHSSCRRGKRVRVILRDGTSVVGKFFEAVSQHVLIDVGDTRHKIRRGNILSLVIYKAT